MKSIFRKYVYFYLAGTILEAVILCAVVISALQTTSDTAHSIVTAISNSRSILAMFNFITSWADVISGLIVCAFLITLYLNYRTYRYNRALIRIHNWARRTAALLDEYEQRDLRLQKMPLQRHNAIRNLVNRLTEPCRFILTDARTLGGEIESRTKKVVYALFTIDDKIEQNDDSVFEDLMTIPYGLTTVISSAQDAAQNSKYAYLLSREMEGDTEPES